MKENGNDQIIEPIEKLTNKDFVDEFFILNSKFQEQYDLMELRILTIIDDLIKNTKKYYSLKIKDSEYEVICDILIVMNNEKNNDISVNEIRFQKVSYKDTNYICVDVYFDDDDKHPLYIEFPISWLYNQNEVNGHIHNFNKKYEKYIHNNKLTELKNREIELIKRIEGVEEDLKDKKSILKKLQTEMEKYK